MENYLVRRSVVVGKGYSFVLGKVDEKELILKLELYFPVYWEDYVMAKMVDDYSILIQLIFLLEKKNLK